MTIWLVPVTRRQLVAVEAGDEYSARETVRETLQTMDVDVELATRAASAVSVEVGAAYERSEVTV
jgi:hypothetical protein